MNEHPRGSQTECQQFVNNLSRRADGPEDTNRHPSPSGMDSRHGAGVCTLSNRARQLAGSKFLHDDDQRAHPRMVHVEQEELFVNLVNKKWVVEAEHRGPDINNFEYEAASLKPISI